MRRPIQADAKGRTQSINRIDRSSTRCRAQPLTYRPTPAHISPVSLTKTTSRGREQKAGVINKLRDVLDEYNSLYVFSFEHMRSAKFKDVRIDWRDSR